MVRAMFADAWEQQRGHAQAFARNLKRAIAEADTQIGQLLDRIVSASSDTVVQAYEQRIAKLEREKLTLAERLQASAKPQRPFEEMFELALGFLANPCNLWGSERLEDKQTVLRLAFSSPPAYCRKTGFRTPETSRIFKVLESFQIESFKLAERQGFEPWVRKRTTVFETAPFDHSGTSPARQLALMADCRSRIKKVTPAMGCVRCSVC